MKGTRNRTFFLASLSLIWIAGTPVFGDTPNPTLEENLQDCYPRVQNGQFGLTNEELRQLAQNRGTNPSTQFLEAERVSLLEIVTCARRKLNDLTYATPTSTNSQGAGIEGLPAEMESFLEEAGQAQSIAQMAELWDSTLQSQSAPERDQALRSAMASLPEADRHFAKMGPSQLRDELKQAKERLAQEISLRGLPKAQVDDTYRTVLHSLMIPSHDLVFWSELRGALKHEKKVAAVHRLTPFGEDANQRQPRDLRAMILRAESYISQIQNSYPVLFVPIQYEGKKLKLGEILDQLYREDVILSKELLEQTDEVAGGYLRQAVGKLAEKNQAATLAMAFASAEDLQWLLKENRVRTLVIHRLGKEYESVANNLYLAQLQKDKHRRERDRNIYYAGAILSTLGGGLGIVARTAAAPSIAFLAPKLTLLGSSIVLAGVSREIYNIAFGDFRRTMPYIQLGLNETIESMEAGQKLSKDLQWALAGWAFAALGAGLSIKWDINAHRVLRNAEIRHYDPQTLVRKVTGKAQVPWLVKTQGGQMPVAVAFTNRSVTLSRNLDRILGLFRRYMKANQAAASLFRVASRVNP